MFIKSDFHSSRNYANPRALTVDKPIWYAVYLWYNIALLI